MSKKSLVQIVQPDPAGARFGQVADPADFLKGERFSHEHIEHIVRDLLVSGAGGPLVVGFDYALPGGLTFRLNNCGHIITTAGLSYEQDGDSTVDVVLADAHPALARIDLVYAALATDAEAEDEFRPFVQLRTEDELEANAPQYPPTQFNVPTELHNRATVQVREGVPAADPVAPGVNADEVALYHVRVEAGAVALVDGNVTEQRTLGRSLFYALQHITNLQTTLDATNTNLTENVQDIVAALLQHGAGLNIVYNDPANTLTISLALTALIITAALGYTPVNKAGDTMSGQLHILYAGVPDQPSLLVDDIAEFGPVIINGPIPSPSLVPILKYLPNASLDNTPVYQVAGTDNGGGQRAGCRQVFYGNLSGVSGFSNWHWFSIFSGPRGLHSFINGQTYSIDDIATGVSHSENGKGFLFRSRDLTALGGLNAVVAVETETHALLFYVLYNGNVVVPGNLQVTGSISKGSGTFLIDHPLDPDSKNLYHGYVESPRYELIYRGRVKLQHGRAEVDVDADAGMTPGTFAALTQNHDLFLNNMSGWTRVRAENLEAVASGRFAVIAEDPDSEDTVAWMVVAERNDPFIKESGTTDAQGHLIPEVDKPAPTPEELSQLEDTVRVVESDEPAEDKVAEEIVKELLGKRGYPMHPEVLGRTLPKRRVTIKTRVRNPQEDEGK
jgi:hypothetical protein